MFNTDTYDLICRHFERIAANGGDKAPAGPVRLLVVDDDEHFILQATSYLPRRGVEVDGARSGSEALRLFAEAKAADRPYRLVLLDLRMPGEHPAEILRELKALDGGKTPVTLCTMFPNADEIHECIKVGYVGLLYKPVDFANLLEVLDYHNITKGGIE